MWENTKNKKLHVKCNAIGSFFLATSSFMFGDLRERSAKRSHDSAAQTLS